MPQQLEYDERGATFYYFLISFYGLVLLPATYFLWPYKRKDASQQKLVCQCDPCRLKKVRLEEERPKERLKTIAKVTVLLVLWLLLFFMLYKVLTVETDYEEYDPFAILELDPSASMAQIRKQYRQLSKVYHPDKQGGNQDIFIKIAKAYEALTDEVSRENWIKYGNPDGPQAATFGIALPSWVVEKQNSIVVLGLYLTVFVVLLPIVVGTWWYRSIKYGTTNLLIQTSHVYLHFLSKHKQMNIRRLLMVLTAAFEFNPQFSKMIPARPSDNEELNEIIRARALPHIVMKVKEPVLGEPFALKACMLLHAHLEKYGLPPATLRPDQTALLKLCPRLVVEMVNTLNQVWVFARYRQRGPQNYTSPSLDVYELTMKLSQMIVQQMWDRQSPFLQLPHVQQDMLRHFRTRRRHITTMEDFAAMKNADRRLLVRHIPDEEYLDVMAVCAGFPHVTLSVETQVMDDDDSHKVTAGSIVTISVTLKRTGLLEFYKVDTDTLLSTSFDHADKEDSVENHVQHDVETLGAADKATPKGQKSWEKTRRKKKAGKVGKKRSGNPKKKDQKKKGKEEEEEDEEEGEREEAVVKERKEDSGSEVEDNGLEEGGAKDDVVDEEEKEWQQLQETMKKKQKKAAEKGSKDSHPVHAPFFPDVKQECWWLYIADTRSQQMVVPPQRVSGLKTELTQDLQFGAPNKPCTLRYVVVLTSDSYLNLQFTTDLKIDVFEHVEVKGRSQWEELEREEELEEVIEESESEGETDQESDSDD